MTNAADAAPSIRLRATAKWRPDAAGGGDVAAMTVRVVGQAVEARARAHTSAQHDQCFNKRGQNSRRHRQCQQRPILSSMKRVPHTPMLHGHAVGIVHEHFALRFVAYLPIDSIIHHAVCGASEPQKRHLTGLMSVVETMDSLTELYVPSSEVA